MKQPGTFKKSLCAALILAAMLLSACAESAADTENEKTEDSAAEVVTETEPEETKYEASYLPDVDYEGYEYRIIDYEECAQYFEAESGNLVDDAVYERNRIIEEKYNINITATTYPFTEYEKVTTLVNNAGRAVSDDFDLATMVFRAAYYAVLEGIVPPASEYPVADFSQPWYIQSINDSITINGVTLLGFTSFDSRPGGECILFNQKIIEDLHLSDPYELVDNGTWTSDKMLAMGMEAIADLDGNGTQEVGDRYAIIGEWDSLTYITYVGSGHLLVNIDETGTPTVSQDEVLYAAFELMQNHTNETGFFLDTFKTFGTAESSRNEGRNLFKQGQSLYNISSTSRLTTMGDMTDDYGIVPNPKWTEDQEDYYVLMDRDIISVPLACSSDLERVCVIREALSVESLNIVNPAFYEVALKNRYVRDEDSIRMLEIISESVVVDLGQSPWWDIVRDPWQSTLSSKKNNFASAVEKNLKRSNKAIDELMECIETIKANY